MKTRFLILIILILLPAIVGAQDTPTPVDKCTQTPAPLSSGDCAGGDTTGLANDFDSTCSGCGSSSCYDGPDVVYSFTVASPGGVVTLVGEADYDADWAVVDYCGKELAGTPTPMVCKDYSEVQADPTCGAITHYEYGYVNEIFSVDAGQYFIWIDGWGADAGNYAVEVSWATYTPTPTPTNTPTNTPTITPTNTPTNTPTPTEATATPTNTPTPAYKPPQTPAAKARLNYTGIPELDDYYLGNMLYSLSQGMTPYYIQIQHPQAAATPPVNSVYVDSSDGKLYFKDAAATPHALY